jgi:hypothetical protein
VDLVRQSTEVDQPAVADAPSVTFRPQSPTVVVLKGSRTLRVKDQDAGRNFIVQARGSDGSVILKSRKLGEIVRVAGAEFEQNFKPWSMR